MLTLTDRTWFSRLLRRPARKRSGSILTTPEPTWGEFTYLLIDSVHDSVMPLLLIADEMWSKLTLVCCLSINLYTPNSLISAVLCQPSKLLSNVTHIPQATDYCVECSPHFLSGIHQQLVRSTAVMFTDPGTGQQCSEI